MNKLIIGTFGLSDEQISSVESNLPSKNCEIMNTDCFTDIVAIGEMAVIVMWKKLSEDDRDLLVDFYSEITPFSETLILIGDVNIPGELRNHVLIYDSFEVFSVNMKHVLLEAFRRQSKLRL